MPLGDSSGQRDTISPPGELHLRRGMIYFLSCNIGRGLVKYTKLVLISWTRNSVRVLPVRDLIRMRDQQLLGEWEQYTVFLPRMRATFSKMNVDIERVQFPLIYGLA